MKKNAYNPVGYIQELDFTSNNSSPELPNRSYLKESAEKHKNFFTQPDNKTENDSFSFDCEMKSNKQKKHNDENISIDKPFEGDPQNGNEIITANYLRIHGLISLEKIIKKKPHNRVFSLKEMDSYSLISSKSFDETHKNKKFIDNIKRFSTIESKNNLIFPNKISKSYTENSKLDETSSSILKKTTQQGQKTNFLISSGKNFNSEKSKFYIRKNFLNENNKKKLEI